ncbi:hypothetical protein ANO11243_087660 [Dothideomycetidae sp. 11243]|nr:hypothetical protein ANO11243_087660 [fungal sp. No.11243]
MTDTRTSTSKHPGPAREFLIARVAYGSHRAARNCVLREWLSPPCTFGFDSHLSVSVPWISIDLRSDPEQPKIRIKVEPPRVPRLISRRVILRTSPAMWARLVSIPLANYVYSIGLVREPSRIFLGLVARFDRVDQNGQDGHRQPVARRRPLRAGGQWSRKTAMARSVRGLADEMWRAEILSAPS